MKSSGIGGQAVLEGVMMKNKDKYAIAVRKPDQEIAIEMNEYKGINEKYPIFRFPILRGVVAFAESMYIGTKALTFSSTFFEEEEEKEKDKKTSEGFFTFITFFFSIVLAVGIFILLPLFLSSLLADVVSSRILLGLLEGVIRVLLFVGYVVAISQMKDINRFFQYHGAEHKTINCIENGYELTVSNVRKQTKEHKRCGTSFMLFVMLVSIVLFMFIQVDTIWLRYVLRILLIPVVAGISYEIIKLAGSSNNTVIRVISKPGMWMQRLTTKEPEDDMIEVAIASVEAVFDWRAYLAENGKRSSKKKNKSNSVKTKAQKQKEVNHGEVNHEDIKQEEVKHKDAKLEAVKHQQGKKAKATSTQKHQATKEKTDMVAATEETIVAQEELRSLDKPLFDKANSYEEKHDQLLEKAKARHTDQVISSIEIAASLEPHDEEDDEILKALDRYLSYEKVEK